MVRERSPMLLYTRNGPMYQSRGLISLLNRQGRDFETGLLAISCHIPGLFHGYGYPLLN